MSGTTGTGTVRRNHLWKNDSKYAFDEKSEFVWLDVGNGAGQIDKVKYRKSELKKDEDGNLILEPPGVPDFGILAAKWGHVDWEVGDAKPIDLKSTDEGWDQSIDEYYVTKNKNYYYIYTVWFTCSSTGIYYFKDGDGKSHWKSVVDTNDDHSIDYRADDPTIIGVEGYLRKPTK